MFVIWFAQAFCLSSRDLINIVIIFSILEAVGLNDMTKCLLFSSKFRVAYRIQLIISKFVLVQWTSNRVQSVHKHAVLLMSIRFSSWARRSRQVKCVFDDLVAQKLNMSTLCSHSLFNR